MVGGRSWDTGQGTLVSALMHIIRFFLPHSTENTGMIAGLGKAAEIVVNHVALHRDHMRGVRDYLEEQLEVGINQCIPVTYLMR
jgi:hypothetical protein